MPDRTDIDALLIGALYGELTPADEARLSAHLESHPADRTALADLTRTRAAVRGSRLLAFQVEPPQAISVLLLREAVRRAPRPAADPDAPSWFQRFVRSFAAHPAMAAAATLVLVFGVAGTLYLRGVDTFVERRPPEASRAQSTAKAEAAPSSTVAAAPAGAAAPAPPPEPEAPQAQAEQAAAVHADRPADDLAAAGSAAGSAGTAASSDGSYRVDLADGKDQPARRPLPTQQPYAPALSPSRAKQAAPGSSDLALAEEKAKAGDARISKLAKSDARGSTGRSGTSASNKFTVAPEPASKSDSQADKKPAGIVVRTPEPRNEPKELKDRDQDAERPKAEVSRDEAPEAAVTAKPGLRRGATSPAGGGAARAAAPEPPATTTPAPANDAPRPAKPAPVNARPQSPPAAAPPPPPPSAGNVNDDAAVGDRNNRGASKTAGPDKALLDWARKQRDQVIALVGANNCRAAASTALAIYNRAPDYYAANVVTDRQIKPCLAYLNSEREREERSRAAAKNATPSDTQAAPPARK